MKRDSNGDTADAHHPALAFHREVLIIQQWTKIRRDFLQALEAVAASGVVQWREPRKLWRHAQEALGKWILSQVARVHLPAPDALHDGRSQCTSSVERLLEAEIRFFPSADQLRRAMANTRGEHVPCAAATSSSPMEGRQELRTYDEQLVRDLSLKSNGTHNSAAVAALVQLVKDFFLAKRCVAAAEAIEAGMQGVTPAQALKPRIRRLEATDPQRTPQQQRIAGPIAEVSVQWPRHWRREQCRDCPPVSLPWAAMEKLRMCYDFFSEASEQAHYPTTVLSADARQHRFHLRAATVILRYEGGLATGSLQLCADTRLKQHLHAAGYHVMDLCASPINAYMKVPQLGRFKGAASDTDDAGAKEVPNHFCSAFYDTDQYFGSIGSAVAVDPQLIYADAVINPEGRPLLLTLDVPYDEDLCELLFQKLVRDMRSATAGGGAVAAAVVDYVLVLPLWWDIHMKIEKRLFGGTGAAKGLSSSSSADPLHIAQLVQERAAVLREGHTVPYNWPEALAAAAGDARTATAAASGAWVCFDGLFIDDDYGYFCAATNKWLHGVTATEVIGLAQPRASPPLKMALDSFYTVPTVSPSST
ncbi:putative Phosphorylated CTD interacting factor 1 WW domain containing protein [Leishmania naiffi]|uniref:Phosphorylated CTD interacting factor 1 WW domain containing protein n=1 Tax=Leishmania naiffi TaxID=5678 RepID=A0AAW3BS09_9TRYP